MSIQIQESNINSTADELGAIRIKQAYDAMVAGENVFLTGDAGTGKTTLLEEFMKNHGKCCVVLAPTGVAAVNAGGQTIHSFFSLPPRSVSWNTIIDLNNYPEKKELFKKIHTVIIDEISMVRADMMDTINMFWKKNFPNDGPFGGRQLIVVGDLDQLPPVVGSPEESQMISQRYNGNEFFFAAKCWQDIQLKIIKLTKVWRQSDPVFIGLLNKIKNNLIEQSDIDFINNKCLFKLSINPDDGSVTKLNPVDHGVVLCATNDTATKINYDLLSRLEGDILELKGEVSGEFNPKNCPVDPVIHLKIGARVMTMRNNTNGKYVNGSLGTLIGISTVDERDLLLVKIDNGDTVEIDTIEYHAIKYKYNKKEDEISSQVAGVFTQYPIKLAYAMTIHKSQGKTFDKIIIDFGRGAFAHGMVYVALSRCRTLEGVSLRVPISKKDLVYNNIILDFNKRNK